MREERFFDERGREVSLPGAKKVAFANQLMRSVYNWMALALVVTGLTAYYVASHFSPQQLMGNGLVWILIIAELVLVFVLSSRIDKLSFATAGLMFVGYSILNGVTLSYIFWCYTMTSIASAFFVSAGMFVAMSLVGYFTKKDLTGIGKYLFMALIGLIIAMVVNLFLRNGTFDLVISCVGVLVFVGLTAWDTQKIKRMGEMYGDNVNEMTQKIALMGSLALYLDFINLFIYMLRFLGRSNR